MVSVGGSNRRRPTSVGRTSPPAPRNSFAERLCVLVAPVYALVVPVCCETVVKILFQNAAFPFTCGGRSAEQLWKRCGNSAVHSSTHSALHPAMAARLTDRAILWSQASPAAAPSRLPPRLLYSVRSAMLQPSMFAGACYVIHSPGWGHIDDMPRPRISPRPAARRKALLQLAQGGGTSPRPPAALLGAARAAEWVGCRLPTWGSEVEVRHAVPLLDCACGRTQVGADSEPLLLAPRGSEATVWAAPWDGHLVQTRRRSSATAERYPRLAPRGVTCFSLLSTR